MKSNSKIKILMVIKSLRFWWWTEKVCVNLWNSLNFEWWKYGVSYFTFYKDEHVYHHKWVDFCLNKKSKNIIGKVLYSFIWAIKLLNICKKENINLMIAYMWSWILASLLSKIFWNKSKLYITIHRSLLDFPKWIVSLFAFFVKRYADKIIVLTETEKNNLIKNFSIDKKKVSVIPNFIEKEKISILYKEPIENYEDIFHNNKFSFISIGRLEKIKNQKLMISTFKELNKNYPNIQLVILWDWKEKESLQKISNNNIYFLWNQENVFKYLYHSDCFLLTSISEAFPMVILEAMACNLPVISTKNQGAIDVLNNDKFWILVDYNERSLYKTMETILNNNSLRNYYKDMSKGRIQNFQKDNIIKLWENIIDA